ncbi:MAG: hypothetical protein JNM85_03085 [Chthonomonas sp.]|nr:hypothetical protein [Chthonomonas sp.]
MPHLQLELSPNLLDVPAQTELLQKLVALASSFETVNSAAVKGYCRPSTATIMGAGAPSGFAHVTFCLMTGRPADLRGHWADAIFALMKEHLANLVDAGECAVTVEIREMDGLTYRK